MLESVQRTKSEIDELYQTLKDLMENWENEIVEFKEAKGEYNLDKLGSYFSAISNEANFRNRQYGWIVLGISEKKAKYPVGTAYKKGKPELLEKLKFEVGRNVTDNMSFIDIVELNPAYEGNTYRVLMFKVPAAIAGIPTAWKNKYFGRDGDSLVPLPQHRIDEIRNKVRSDWSKALVPKSGIQHLDKEAVAFARRQYIEKMNKPHITEEINKLTDEEFLTKLKLMQDGCLTNAAMVLLGNSDYTNLMECDAPKIMWRLFDANGQMKDHAMFDVPFIAAPDKIFARMRNLTYRYMPNQLSLFPKETQQYDSWLLRELLNNCIAHSNYRLGGRIYVNEEEDTILITNPGDFLPRSIVNVLKPSYNPPFYRNQLLADSMVNFHMIDTATSGIKKVYRIQRDKYFPMPDYDLSKDSQVDVRVYGKILDEKFTYILFDHPEMDLEAVYLLDQVQKGNSKILSDDAIKYMRKNKLVEGKKSNLFLSYEVAKNINEEAQYIKNKGFDNKYYKDLIVEYLRIYNTAQRNDINRLLEDKLPAVLDDQQKRNKISYLLDALKKAGIIERDSSNQQKGSWILVK